jgi:fatty acid synthase
MSFIYSSTTLLQDVLKAEAEKQRLRSMLRDLVEECKVREGREANASEAHPSISGRLLRLRDPAARLLSDDRLLEEFLIFFIAGSETTGHTIAWTLCAHTPPA